MGGWEAAATIGPESGNPEAWGGEQGCGRPSVGDAEIQFLQFSQNFSLTDFQKAVVGNAARERRVSAHCGR
jgi:hypothetical protein